VQLCSPAVAAAQYDRPWKHIADDLRTKIEHGRWQPGDRLPTLGQLQVDYGVAKGTINNAIRQLRTDGVISTRPGSGLYVAERSQPDTP